MHASFEELPAVAYGSNLKLFKDRPLALMDIASLLGSVLPAAAAHAALSWVAPSGKCHCTCACGLAEAGLVSVIREQLQRCGPSQLTREVCPVCSAPWALVSVGFLLGVFCSLGVAVAVARWTRHADQPGDTASARGASPGLPGSPVLRPRGRLLARADTSDSGA